MKLSRRSLFAAFAGLFVTAKAAPCLSRLRPAPERHCFRYGAEQCIYFDEVVSICRATRLYAWEIRTQLRAPSWNPHKYAGIYEYHYLTVTNFTLFRRAYRCWQLYGLHLYQVAP